MGPDDAEDQRRYIRENVEHNDREIDSMPTLNILIIFDAHSLHLKKIWQLSTLPLGHK